MSDQAAFLERLKSYEGRSCGPAEKVPDPVNVPMIRHWVEALGDLNPVYLDAEVAERSIHKGIVAPPTMLQAWGMRGLRRQEPGEPSSMDELMELLDQAGFTSVVATNCEQTYDRYLRPGDHLVQETVIESVSEEKSTALGPGHFVTTRTEYRTVKGEPVGRMTFRILKFRPKEVA
jgi:acyl dehydratase